MKPERIEEGDLVNIEFGSGRMVGGCVLYGPCQPGDYWILRRDPDFCTVYVQQFETMTLRQKNIIGRLEEDNSCTAQ